MARSMAFHNNSRVLNRLSLIILDVVLLCWRSEWTWLPIAANDSRAPAETVIPTIIGLNARRM
jgi:hypothetical protein